MLEWLELDFFDTKVFQYFEVFTTILQFRITTISTLGEQAYQKILQCGKKHRLHQILHGYLILRILPVSVPVCHHFEGKLMFLFREITGLFSRRLTERAEDGVVTSLGIAISDMWNTKPFSSVINALVCNTRCHSIFNSNETVDFDGI